MRQQQVPKWTIKGVFFVLGDGNCSVGKWGSPAIYQDPQR